MAITTTKIPAIHNQLKPAFPKIPPCSPSPFVISPVTPPPAPLGEEGDGSPVVLFVVLAPPPPPLPEELLELEELLLPPEPGSPVTQVENSQ